MPIALLAPLPQEYLEQGEKIIRQKGRVAFGSRSSQVFQKADKLRQGDPIVVYVYASGPGRPERVEVSWTARYIGYVESRDGEHPAGKEWRPDATATDQPGHWVVFWEVIELKRLPEGERIPIDHFSGYGKSKPYKSNYTPRGPGLVNAP